jgi:hypothetical protein
MTEPKKNDSVNNSELVNRALLTTERQRCRADALHPPRHPVVAVMLGLPMKDKPCVLLLECAPLSVSLHWFHIRMVTSRDVSVKGELGKGAFTRVPQVDQHG